MKVRQAIELARGLKQIDQVNYPDLLMLQFLNECEGKLQTEFLHIADVDCQRYTEDDMEMDLIVGPPHDKLYYAYLCAMIDFTNGEYAKYNNSIIVANAFMAEWAAWFNRTHERDGRQYLGVFLSAYGIAVKHGYAGTEEEWLASLEGPAGPQGIQGEPGPQGAPGSVTFDELTEEQLAMLKGPEGPQGVPGIDGQDGIGIQFVEQTTTSTEDGGTNVVTVTKTDGTTSTFYVRNGSRGSTGPAGSDGQDGVSPLVSVSEITGGHRVSIQDADGTSSFDVMDGKDGANGQDGKDGQSGAAGADGITPTIGANGNWYVGQTDTGVAATGPQGPQGIQGIQGQAGLAGSDGQDGVDGKSAYQYAVEGGYTGTEEAFSAKLAAEIPTVLPNPNALTFTGSVSGSYDGSAPLEVEIPSGGGGGNPLYVKGGTTLAEGTIPSGLAQYTFTDTGLKLYEVLQEWKIFFIQVYCAGEVNNINIFTYQNNSQPFYNPGKDCNYALSIFEGVTKDSVKFMFFSAGVGSYWDVYSPTGTISSHNMNPAPTLSIKHIPPDTGLYLRNYGKDTGHDYLWKVTGLVKWG